MKKDFPDNFFWGASTSSYQVEGNNTNTDWWEWEKAGYTEPSAAACDHYNRFREDFALAKALGHNAHRLGIEWARLEPEEGFWDEKEWLHYEQVLSLLKELGIEPFVTLQHFTLPFWLSKKGGWTNDDSTRYFVRFAERCITRLGRHVKYWITINEPHMAAFIPHFYGKWPPMIKDQGTALHTLLNMLKAHTGAYAAMHAVHAAARDHDGISHPYIGLAKAVAAFHPCSAISIPDRMAAATRSDFHNHAFIRSALKGVVEIPGLPKEKLPLCNAMDFIGLNYYYRQFISSGKPCQEEPLGGQCAHASHPGEGQRTDMGWEIYPKGIYEVCMTFRKYKKPVLITENGIATGNDKTRTAYINSHLFWLSKALKDKLDLRGYLHWSLLDNFEWSEGYSKRFGLVEVDFSTQERRVRMSAKHLSRIISSGLAPRSS
ncbi:MAG: glycoside hydrolase family 1 protein [Candidatus Omnitrophica bacterium]|nr:glycoside hydrolase family 1 protein [Candidatus Omnitrophota bacterium]